MKNIKNCDFKFLDQRLYILSIVINTYNTHTNESHLSVNLHCTSFILQ